MLECVAHAPQAQLIIPISGCPDNKRQSISGELFEGRAHGFSPVALAQYAMAVRFVMARPNQQPIIDKHYAFGAKLLECVMCPAIKHNVD